MHFEFNPENPIIFEGWMQKANIGIFERWQKRYFRLQGRCIFYFKKDQGLDPPNGFIPLIDVDISDLPPKKGRSFGFKIQLIGNPKIAKKCEYFICTDTEEQRIAWKNVIFSNTAYSIVGQPFIKSCRVTFNDNKVENLIPYFIPPIYQILESSAYKLRGVWTIEVPTDFVENGIAILNQNYQLQTDDIHNALAVLLAFIKSFPEGLLKGEAMNKLTSKIHPDDIRTLVREAPAPHRQFLKMFGLHFKKVLDFTNQNGVTQYSIIPFLGPLLIRPAIGSTIPPAQAKSIQDQIAQIFLTHAARILDDVHQFLDTTRQTVLYRARVIGQPTQKSDEILNVSRGLLLNVVREDECGWCNVYTSNMTVGLIHKSIIKRLTPEEENELKSGPNIDALMDVVRENSPEFILLFDSMNNEIIKIRETLELIKK